MISEREYRLGASCPTKILHSRAGLPRADQHDSFATWMQAESGKFRALAKQLFPAAAEVGEEKTLEAVFQRTQRLLDAGRVIAGATFLTSDARCRVDIVEPDGPVLRLYSYVPKTVDLERHRFGLEFWSQPDRIRREWKEHLDAMAFRAWIVRQIYPDKKIVPLMVVPIHGASSSVDGLHSCFAELVDGWEIIDAQAAVEASRLLRAISVVGEVDTLIAGVANKVEVLNLFLRSPTDPILAYKCKKCEFKVIGEDSGYETCHSDLARVTPHIFDLIFMYFITGNNRRPIADQLLAERRVSLWDIPLERIVGEYSDRQRMQLEGTATGREIIRPGMASAMADVVYPLAVFPRHRDAPFSAAGSLWGTVKRTRVFSVQHPSARLRRCGSGTYRVA